MRLATFKIRETGATTIGAYVGDRYLDLHAASGGGLPDRMIPFLELGDAGMARARMVVSMGIRPAVSTASILSLSSTSSPTTAA